MIANYKLAHNTSDFFAFNTKVANILRNSGRNHLRFIRGQLQALDVNITFLQYRQDTRKFGESHYNIIVLNRLAIRAILASSTWPVKLIYKAHIILLLITTLCSTIWITGYPSTSTQITYPNWLTLYILFSLSIIHICSIILSRYSLYLLKDIQGTPIYTIKNITSPC